MSHIPSLDPRGPHSRSNPWLIHIFEGVLTWGAIRLALRGLDLFGKGEAAVDVYRFLPHFFYFLGTPIFSGLAILSGFAGLIWQAAKQARIPDSIPKYQLVHPDTKLPISSKPRIWANIKRPVWASVAAILIAIPIWACYKTTLRHFIFVDRLPNAAIKYPTVPQDLRYASEHFSGPTEKPLKAKPISVPMAAVPYTPQQQSTPSSTLSSAPEAIIPRDPEKAIQAVNAMRSSLEEVLDKKDTITFLISWPGEDSSSLVLVSGILNSACRTSPRQCWFAQRTNPDNLDFPQIPQPIRRGLTIHGADASSISGILGRWFSTYSSSPIPQQLNAYKDPSTKELIWVEIGPGSPWKTPN